MKQGNIIEEGPTSPLFSAPQHEYTQSLLKAVPKPKWLMSPEAPSAIPGAPRPERTRNGSMAG
ncbi:hypothetical protein I6F07_29395 [Ensifer sp. IC4062]|nr:hypothetical protein [Ensifer sp. IC4062]MCA1444236.1 hypothetical protein [Ensifer sp. IC4062]